MQMSRKQFEQGRRGTQLRYGLNRRDFLRAGVAVPALGAAAYYGYHQLKIGPVNAALVGTGEHARANLIGASNPKGFRFVAAYDVRPSQVAAAKSAFARWYGPLAETIAYPPTFGDVLANKDIDVVVIATPTPTHARLAVEAMEAGKHVLVESMMASNLTDAKAMVQVAQRTGRILAVSHQRHYNIRYADAVDQLAGGDLGEVKFIQATGHFNHTLADAAGKKIDPWNPPVPEADKAVDPKLAGFATLEQLVGWRLDDTMSAGVFGECLVHQFDGLGILMGENFTKPIAVSGMGGLTYLKDGRTAPDHIFLNYEFPQGVVVTYSAILTNGLESRSEVYMGTRGTLSLRNEQDSVYYQEIDPLMAERRKSKQMKVETVTAKKGETSMYSGPTGAYVAGQGSTGSVSPGWKEQFEHLAFAVRNPGLGVPADGRVGLANMVFALAGREAIRQKGRLEIKPSWFDPGSKDVPDAPPTDKTVAAKAGLA